MSKTDDLVWIAKMDALKRLSEDELRERIQAIMPEIRHEVAHVEDLLRELVQNEREKCGLSNHQGQIMLEHNNKKKESNEPDLVGSGFVDGKKYRAAAWVQPDGKLKIGLTNYKHHGRK